MSRRNLAQMTEAEIDAFLHEPHQCRIGTINPGGRIHLVTMNYGFVDGIPAFWSYARAQKVVNLQRNPEIGMLVDAGRDYSELRGVHLMGRGEIVTDVETVASFADSLASRYGGIPGAARASASKRALIKVHAEKILSWDHRKLDGKY